MSERPFCTFSLKTYNISKRLLLCFKVFLDEFFIHPIRSGRYGNRCYEDSMTFACAVFIRFENGFGGTQIKAPTSGITNLLPRALCERGCAAGGDMSDQEICQPKSGFD